MTIAERQIAASTGTMKIGSITYRYRKVSSADIVAAGGGFLLAMRAQAGGPVEESQEDAKARVLAALQRDPSLLASGHTFQAAVTCAGVYEASADEGKTWEPYRLVMDRRQENGPAGRAHFSVLGPHVGKLAKAIMRLTNEEGGTGEEGETFPGGSARGAVDSAGPRREGVRS